MGTSDGGPERDVLRSAHEALAGGRSVDAQALLEARLAREPADCDAWHLLAMVQREQGRLHEAITCLERALEVRARDPQGWNNLGGLRRETGDLGGAADAFARALAIDPDHASSLFNAAALEHARHAPERAASMLQRLLARHPGDAAGWNLLGLALADAQRIDEALDALQRAARLAPRVAEVHNNHGVVLGYAGRGEQARTAFREALRVAPDFARAWENLVRSARLSEADAPMLDAMRQVLARLPADSDDAVCLRFALGKGLDDLGRYAQAFEHYRLGNASIARVVDYDADWHDAFVDGLIRVFDAAMIERLRRVASATSCPVYILGMPRSGTTLVEQLLAAHPAVRAGGELAVVPDALQALEVAIGEPLPGAIAHADDRQLAGLAQSIAQAMELRAKGTTHLSDKLPGNYLYVGLLHGLLPGARIVHCRREAKDTCLSIFFQRFAHGVEFAYSLAQIGRRHRSYQRLMAHWRALLGPSLVEVDYEALVTDPREQAACLYHALDLQFVPDYLGQIGRGEAVITASSWQVRRPIGADAVGRWRHYAPYLAELDAALAGDPPV